LCCLLLQSKCVAIQIFELFISEKPPPPFLAGTSSD